MKKKISICGIDCSECPAYEATLSNDVKAKKQVALEWTNDKCVLEAGDIECRGCLISDWKVTHNCETRKCCISKGHTSCAYCDEYPCEKYKDSSKNLDKINEAFKLASESEVAYLSYVDEEGYPITIAMLSMGVEELSSIWFIANAGSKKIGKITKNSKASVCYSNNNIYQGLTLVGDLEIITDEESKKKFWKDSFEVYYSKDVDNPDYCVLKFSAKWASYHRGGLFEFYI